MRHFLLASVATAGLAFVAPAFAQTTVPLPASPPPIVAPSPNPDATVDEQVGTSATPSQAPTVGAQGDAAVATQAAPAPVTADVQAQAAAPLAGEAANEVVARPIAPPTAEAQVAAPDVQAQTAAPDATAQAQVAAPNADVAATAEAPAMQAAAPQTAVGGAVSTPTSASDVCATRTTSVHFGARGSALSTQNRDAIQNATDAASACSLETVTIVDSAEGRMHSRRAEAVRATLLRQGVPAERITIAQEVNADAEAASTGRLDVRMAFAGVARQAVLEPQATSGPNAAAQPTLQVAENVVPAASPVEPAPDAPTPETAMTSPAPETAPEADAGAAVEAAPEQQPGS